MPTNRASFDAALKTLRERIGTESIQRKLDWIGDCKCPECTRDRKDARADLRKARRGAVTS